MQPPEVFCKKGVLISFAKFKTPSVFFLWKKKLCHRCFPVNFGKFPLTYFFTEHLRWLLLLKAPLGARVLNSSSQNDSIVTGFVQDTQHVLEVATNDLFWKIFVVKYSSKFRKKHLLQILRTSFNLNCRTSDYYLNLLVFNHRLVLGFFFFLINLFCGTAGQNYFRGSDGNYFSKKSSWVKHQISLETGNYLIKM